MLPFSLDSSTDAAEPVKRPTRKGQPLSRKACDLCRDRKKKCRFEAQASCCTECEAVGLTCTYNEHRKKRGPRSWRLERFKASAAGIQASSSPEAHFDVDEVPPHLQSVGEAARHILIEHLVPLGIFKMIINEYLSLVYPVIPIVHRPSFQRRLSTQDYERDPAFLRLCLSICAVTTSSMPRKIGIFGFGHYHDCRDLVTRAYSLVMASRFASTQDWADTPSMDTLLCSYLLSCASHYTEKASRAWMLMNESLQTCRGLNIWNRDGYTGLSAIDAQIYRRIFWLLYIAQVHDRLAHISVFAQLGQDPVLKDWEFLLPLEVSDEELERDAGSSQAAVTASTPIISGFAALIRVFLCIGQLISNRKPLSSYQPNPSWTTNFLDQLRLNPPYIPHGPAQECADIDSLRQMLRNLTNVLNDLPPELQIPLSSAHTTVESQQFEIMQANIHITRLFFQSAILERCSTVFYDSSGLEAYDENAENTYMSQEQIAKIELWKAREMIATELLRVLNYFNRDSLEANGASAIIKIREIAATLLGRDDDRIIGSDVAQRAEKYIQNFVEVLSVLDYSHRNVLNSQSLDAA